MDHAPIAHAQERPASQESANDLDGVYIALGPTANAVRANGAWDGAFGGEIVVTRVRERSLLGALGLAAGAARYARSSEGGLGRGTGRVWLDLQVGTGVWPGSAVGLSVGIAGEIDPVIAPRLGGQATLWVFAGVIPFIRVGAVQKNGTYIDFGIKVALPAVRI